MRFILLACVGLTLLASACQSKAKDNTTSTEAKPATTKNTGLVEDLNDYISTIESGFDTIPETRKTELKAMARVISDQAANQEASKMIFICTHNSRRSHMSQLWAQTAAYHYNISNVHCFSGGTEATAFNHRSVRALRKAGFSISQSDSTNNPVYMVQYAYDQAPIKGFSKKFADPFNPQSDFTAVMTCSHADEQCPYVPGASHRIAIPYEDPKVADNTANEEAKYDERCQQIATELFYAFSLVEK